MLISILILVPGLFAFAEREGLLNQLLAPGPLIIGHKNLEGTRCLDCHGVGKGIVDSKCLACHKEIQSFKKVAKGFHGLTNKACLDCHSDHKGREFDSTKLDEKKFDHKATGFVLDGEHAEIKCAECHLQKRTKMKIRKTDTHYLGAAKSCNECHKKEDPHFFVGNFAKQLCSECHNTTDWKTKIQFDHDRDTKYKLVEAHGKLKCMDCHQTKGKAAQSKFQYQWPQLATSKCLSCHDDFHKKALGPKWPKNDCLSCHSQTVWKIENFDHKKTDFELKGKHEELKCLECHKQKINLPSQGPNRAVWTGLRKNCNSCHKDVHEYGSYVSKLLGTLNKCETCHGETEWKTYDKFNHNEKTHFDIDGKHLDMKCEACHIPRSFKYNSKSMLPGVVSLKKSIYHFEGLSVKTCNTCHTNPHLGVFSEKRAKMKCTECHISQGWNLEKKDGLFDHAKTRFALTGAHAKVKCDDCHIKDNKKIYKFPLKVQGGCIDCHDNVHLGQMNEKFSKLNCNDCHNSEKWNLFDQPKFKFDHKQTRFELTGDHSETSCKDCHKEQKPHYRQFLFKGLEGKFCSSCHENVHKGQFSKQFVGKACYECHDTKDFAQRLKFDHSETDYPLRGKHEELKCSECHTPHKELGLFESGHRKGKFVFANLARKDCAVCHKDEHQGQFGNSCSQCHNEKNWSTTKDFHKNFSLSGIHLTLTCNECHSNDRHLAGTSNNCLFCHKKDDVHLGTLPNCSHCHNQNFWDARVFQHSRTRFPLRGVHRTLDCLDCHNRGIYRGTPSECSSCHLSDAVNATSSSHSPIGNFMDCTSCHRNHFSFDNPN
jgi:hypothetical protein